MKKAFQGICVLSVSILVAVGCGSDGKSSGKVDVSGTIKIDGSSTVLPITQAISEEYQGENSKTKVTVAATGTGGGIEKFCNGEIDIADASRMIEPEEQKLCSDNKVEYVELRIATDGIVIVTNKEKDDLSCLTVGELKKMWMPNNTIKSWADIDEKLGSDPIELFGPGTSSGTFDYFTEEIVGEKGSSRSDYTASEDDNILVQGIAGSPNGLGYFGYGYYVENKDKLHLVEVDGGNGCVKPTVESIDDQSYAPLSRPLYIYVSKKAAAKEHVAEFVDFYLDTVSEIAGDVGFIPAHKNDMDTTRDAWAKFTA